MYTPLPPSSEAFEHLDWSAIEPWYRELTATALEPATLLAFLTHWSRLSELVDETSMRLEIAWSQNTADRAAAQRQQRFLETIAPQTQSFDQQIRHQFLASGLEPEGFAIPLRNLRAEAALFREANLSLVGEEQHLCTTYQQIRAAQTVVWEGQTVSIPSLSAHLEQADRELRERAWRLISERQRADCEALDTLWAKVLQVRQQIARNAGYDNYRDYRWQQLFRFDYTPADCQTFHAAVAHVLVPETHPLWEKRRTLLKVDTLRPWDSEVDPRGNTSPLLSSDGRTREQQCATLFGCIDPHLASYVETMIQEQLLDLDARPGKANMNCTFSLPARRRPFLFANLKGSVRDVFVLLHEAGHAFHEFEMGQLPYHHQRKEGFLPLEFAEVASTSMELIGPMHLHQAGLCSQRQQAQLCVRRLERTAMHWLPFSARIDAFQHWVYDHPQQAMDPRACDHTWASLSRRYFPWVDWSGLDEALRTGWQQVQHIYCFPFYYIEYALAALGALQIWNNYRHDPRTALPQYRSALALGATKTVPELFAAAGATFAFDTGTLQSAIHALMQTIEEWESRI
jgi:oligoendopeptidase F